MALNTSHTVTRRGFIVGSAAAAATAAATLSGCNSTSPLEEIIESVRIQFPSANVEYLDVDPSQVLPHTGMNSIESVDVLSETSDFDLPLGSLVYQSSDTRALVITRGASSKALIRLGFIDLEGGDFTPILGQALGANEDFVIYDARASENAIIWVECNMVHGLWRVYAAPLTDGMAAEEDMLNGHLLDEGEGNYSPPQLAVSGYKLYWTVMPDPNGPDSTEDSHLMAAEFVKGKIGDAPKSVTEPQVVYISHGRMITNPTVSDGILTIVPRVAVEGSVYYQLTTLDIASDEVLEIAVLPPSLRVANAVWLGHGFTFGIEGNYEYAKGLSLFGTYQQLGGGQYLYINKAPSSAVVQIDGITYVKSTKNILGLDADYGNALVVDTIKDCVSYGDILAGAGAQKRLVLYTTVISRIGRDSGTCRVRVFDYLSL